MFSQHVLTPKLDYVRLIECTLSSLKVLTPKFLITIDTEIVNILSLALGTPIGTEHIFTSLVEWSLSHHPLDVRFKVIIPAKYIQLDLMNNTTINTLDQLEIMVYGQVGQTLQ
jgi:hypothetical protein